MPCLGIFLHIVPAGPIVIKIVGARATWGKHVVTNHHQETVLRQRIVCPTSGDTHKERNFPGDGEQELSRFHEDFLEDACQDATTKTCGPYFMDIHIVLIFLGMMK